MKCQTTHQLSQYIDGELGPGERSRVERHIRSCPECGRALEGMRKTWDLLERLPQAGPAPYLATRVLARAGERAGDSPAGWFQRLVFPATAAAAVAVGLWLGSLTGRNGETAANVSAADETPVVLAYLDHFDDLPSASLGDAYFNIDAQE
jgi:anti-sigma factor RsiW